METTAQVDGDTVNVEVLGSAEVLRERHDRLDALERTVASTIAVVEAQRRKLRRLKRLVRILIHGDPEAVLIATLLQKLKPD